MGRKCCRKTIEAATASFTYIKTTVSGVTTVADIITDVLVAKTFWDTNQIAWFGLRSVVYSCSLADARGLTLSDACSVLILGLNPFIGTFTEVRNRAMFNSRGMLACDTIAFALRTLVKEALHLDLLQALFAFIFRQDRTQESLRTIESAKRIEMVFEAIPQSLLQTYVIVLQFATLDPATKQRIVPNVQQAISLLLSISTIAIGITFERWKIDYSGALVEVATPERAKVKSGFVVMIASLIWTFFEICVRTASIAIFAVAYKGWVLVALGAELFLRLILMRLLHACNLVAFFTWSSGWISALRQLLVMQHWLDAHDISKSSWDRVLFALLTVAIQLTFILLPTFNEVYPQLRPTPQPLASGVCWQSEYREHIPKIFLDVVSPTCVNRFPAMFIVVALASAIASLVGYLLWQCCDTRYKVTARRVLQRAKETPMMVDDADGTEQPPAADGTGAAKEPAADVSPSAPEPTYMKHLVVADGDSDGTAANPIQTAISPKPISPSNRVTPATSPNANEPMVYHVPPGSVVVLTGASATAASVLSVV